MNPFVVTLIMNAIKFSGVSILLLVLVLNVSAIQIWWNTDYPVRHQINNISDNITYTLVLSVDEVFHFVTDDSSHTYLYNNSGVYAIATENIECNWYRSTTCLGYNPSQVSNGMVGGWSLDDTSGNTTIDCSGNSNTGTCYNNTGGVCNWTTGKVGYGIEFDGVDDYINCGNDSSLVFGDGDFSLEVWIKTTGTGYNSQYILQMGSTNAGDDSEWGYATYKDGRVNIWLYDFDGDYVDLYSTITVNDGNWHHLVAIRNSNTKILKIYVDGVEDTNETYITCNLSKIGNNLAIGKDNSGTASINIFNDTIDEVHIYNRSLSTDEIMEHYQNGIGNRSILGAGESFIYDYSLSGHVLDSFGSTLADAIVQVVGGSSSTSNTSGFYSVSANRGTHTVYAVKSGYYRQIRSIDLYENITQNFTLSAPGYTVSDVDDIVVDLVGYAIVEVKDDTPTLIDLGVLYVIIVILLMVAGTVITMFVIVPKVFGVTKKKR